jgi:plastocyanin
MVNDPTASPTAPYSFSPKSLAVTCGGTVKITNNTAYVHTMSPTSGGFTDSGDVGAGLMATVRFSYRGTFGFYCGYHPNMNGTVKVS